MSLFGLCALAPPYSLFPLGCRSYNRHPPRATPHAGCLIRRPQRASRVSSSASFLCLLRTSALRAAATRLARRLFHRVFRTRAAFLGSRHALRASAHWLLRRFSLRVRTTALRGGGHALRALARLLRAPHASCLIMRLPRALRVDSSFAYPCALRTSALLGRQPCAWRFVLPSRVSHAGCLLGGRREGWAGVRLLIAQLVDLFFLVGPVPHA